MRKLSKYEADVLNTAQPTELLSVCNSKKQTYQILEDPLEGEDGPMYIAFDATTIFEADSIEIEDLTNMVLHEGKCLDIDAQ